MRGALRAVAVGGAVVSAAAVAARPASAGTPAAVPVATFGLGMSAFVEDPAGTVIYAAVPAANEVVAVSPATLKVVGTLSTGTDPVGLSLSRDGSELYVANDGGTSVGVIDTATFTAGTPVPLGAGVNPLAVVPGVGNRLYVLTGHQNSLGSIEQVDATTGASTGPNAPRAEFYGGDLVGTPDGRGFYYADYHLSGSYLARYDVTGAAPAVVWSIDPGANGRDLELSRDRTEVVLACGGGNNGVTGQTYADAVYDAADGSVAGEFHVGEYPESFAFSPDAAVAYAGEATANPNLQAFSLTSFAAPGVYAGLGGSQASADPQKLFVDATGRYLFADLGSTTAVYATGRVAVPEPAAAGLLAVAAAGLLGRRRRA